MPQKHVVKWFHRIGPLNWYRREWVRFEFEVLSREFGIIWLREAGRFIWIFGGKIVTRGDFNLPSVTKGGLRFSL